jgi:hypothetical protein
MLPNSKATWAFHLELPPIFLADADEVIK